MRQSRLPLLLALIAFGLALLSGWYAYNQVLQTVPALVAIQDIPAGKAMTGEMVRVIRVPAGSRAPQALFGPGQVAGMYAAVPLFAGEFLSARHITGQPPVTDPLTTLDAGQRVISLPVRPEAVLGGTLRPGDMVDVAAAYPPADAKSQAVVEVLAAGVKVIDLRNAAAISTKDAKENGGEGGKVPASVLLLVTSQQARSLTAAAESKATIYLWLLGREQG